MATNPIQGVVGVSGFIDNQPIKLTGGQLTRAIHGIGQLNSILTTSAAYSLTTTAPAALTTAQCASLIAAQIVPGALHLRTTVGVAFTETFPAAVDLTATFPEVDIGQTIALMYVNTVAFTATFAAGAGNTLTGVATNAGSGLHNHVFLTKTGAAAWAIQVA